MTETVPGVPTDPLERLRRIAAALMDVDNDRDTLSEALRAAHSIFQEIHSVVLAEGDKSTRYRKPSPFGEFLSPAYAAQTMQDPLRTTKYLRGLMHAIEAAAQEHPDERIHVLYPGCGPNAPFLIFPALLLGNPARVGFTLVEVLPEAVRPAEQLIRGLGLSDYLLRLVEQDATEFQYEESPENGGPVRVIVCEALRRALSHEPQVAILRRLLPQGVDGGRGVRLVPERIVLNAMLTSPSYELSRLPRGSRPRTGPRVDLGEVFSLDRETILGWREDDPQGYAGRTKFPARSLTMPDEIGEADQLTILTKLYFPGGEVLDEWESGLTSNLLVTDLGAARPGEQIELEYELSEDPGLRFYPVAKPSRF